ncbi:MAG: hypothetical protein DELT_00869 [Desulfovibrio sp.]
MGALIPLMFLFFPALELWVLIQVGKEIGALTTVALVFLSIIVGLFLLRLRGLSVARTMRADLSAGRLPANPLVDAFCLMIAGWLFIFPGFVSDAIALLLIIPGIRHILLALFAAWMKKRGFETQTVHFNSSAGDSGTTWTCTTYGNGTAPSQSTNAHPKRPSSVIIDCEPQAVSPAFEDDDSGKTGDDTVIDVNGADKKQ